MWSSVSPSSDASSSALRTQGFMKSAVVDVCAGPSCSPTFSTMYRSFRIVRDTRYGPKNFPPSFKPGPNWVLLMATKSPLRYCFALLRLLLKFLLFSSCVAAIFLLASSRNSRRCSSNFAAHSSMINLLTCASSLICFSTPTSSWKGVFPVLLLMVEFKYLWTWSTCLYQSSGLGAASLVNNGISVLLTLSACPFPLGTPVVVSKCSMFSS